MQTQRQMREFVDESLHERNRAAKWPICEETARISARHFGKALRAVVLTGSLARDEGTFVPEGAHWRLLGDADFYLVFHDHARLPRASSVEAIEQEIEQSLNGQGFVASIGLAPVHGTYFSELPFHILSYELRTCGHVVWGDRAILSLIPEFSPKDISTEDAWRLLANRMIELLEAVACGDHELSPETQYRTAKLYLDMATSYLVFAGRYLPTYREREEAIRRLANCPSDPADSPFPLGPFADRVSDCTRFKLEGKDMMHEPVELCVDAIGYAGLLWRWELQRLTGEVSPISDSELMFLWVSQQPVNARIRGWASVLRRWGWHRSWREWPRWVRLAWRSSPRYWVYSAAAEILFRLPGMIASACGHGGGDVDWRALADRLPLAASGESKIGTPAWQQLARIVALNYHRFLEGTLA